MPTPTQRSGATLGPTQRHVLLVLANRGEATAADWGAWWPLTTEQARGAIDRLYRRGLVQPVRWDGAARVWALAPDGQDIAAVWGEALEGDE